jgi:hypothetical protein
MATATGNDSRRITNWAFTGHPEGETPVPQVSSRGALAGCKKRCPELVRA